MDAWQPPFDKINAEAGAVVLSLYCAPVPPMFHYTSGEGLLGILESGTLRGGNVSFLNDQSELSYGLSLTRSIAKARLSVSSSEFDQRLLQWIEADTTKPFAIGDDYMVSFCEKADLLSQWRGYGAQDSRYCIEFDANEFASALGVASPIMPVVYDSVRQQEMLDRVFSIHIDGIRSIYELAREDSERLLLLRLSMASFFHVCSKLLPFFKDAAFEEEHEWRSVLSLYSEHEHDESLAFRCVSGIMKPSLPLIKGKSGTLPVKKVIAGASRAPGQSVKAAKLMLGRFAYSSVPVDLSRIPLSG